MSQLEQVRVRGTKNAGNEHSNLNQTGKSWETPGLESKGRKATKQNNKQQDLKTVATESAEPLTCVLENLRL